MVHFSKPAQQNKMYCFASTLRESRLMPPTNSQHGLRAGSTGYGKNFNHARKRINYTDKTKCLWSMFMKHTQQPPGDHLATSFVGNRRIPVWGRKIFCQLPLVCISDFNQNTASFWDLFAEQSVNSLLGRPSKTSHAQTVQNRPVNSQLVGLSFTTIRSFFYINQPAQTADLSSM